MGFLTGPRHTAQVFWVTSQMLLLLLMESLAPKLLSKNIHFEPNNDQNKDDHDRGQIWDPFQKLIPGKCFKKEVVLWMLPWPLFSATVSMPPIIINYLQLSGVYSVQSMGLGGHATYHYSYYWIVRSVQRSVNGVRRRVPSNSLWLKVRPRWGSRCKGSCPEGFPWGDVSVSGIHIFPWRKERNCLIGLVTITFLEGRQKARDMERSQWLCQARLLATGRQNRNMVRSHKNRFFCKTEIW